MAKRKPKAAASTKIAPVPTPSPGEGFGPETPEVQSLQPDEIVKVLEGYRREATTARMTGLNPRDDKWRENLALYWNRWDFSKKASWQAQETMPEVPTFVDRFAASMKEALNSTPKGFYSVEDDTDTERDLADAIKRMTDVWLARVGYNQVGQCMDFSGVFEEQMKLGALMGCAATCSWKEDVKYGRVSLESVDPQKIWLDHTGRALYRIRRVELDRHDLPKMARMQDSTGNPLFDLTQILRATASMVDEDNRRRTELTGTGQEVSSNRVPVVLDEYIATVVGPDGNVAGEENSLFVVLNERFLIRGPEKNPFWHGKDWLTYTPLVIAPLSPYGRTYMEDFGSVAKTFNELTNTILDAVQTSSLRAFVMAPGMLLNPQQVSEGIWPLKIFALEDGVKPADFFAEIELGHLGPESFQVWQSLKSELREVAGQNEIALGQFAPRGRTSATEVSETQQSTSALVRSIATTVETRWLNPTLDLVWKTGLQHVHADDPAMAAAVGPDLWQALYQRRRELVERPVTFSARGISTLLYKTRKLRTFLTALQVMSSNPLLFQTFVQTTDIAKVMRVLLELFDIDLSSISLTERQKMIQSMVASTQAAVPGQPGQGTPGGGSAIAPEQTQQVADVGRMMMGMGA